MQPVTCLLRKFSSGAYRTLELQNIHLISFAAPVFESGVNGIQPLCTFATKTASRMAARNVRDASHLSAAAARCAVCSGSAHGLACIGAMALEEYKRKRSFD